MDVEIQTPAFKQGLLVPQPVTSALAWKEFDDGISLLFMHYLLYHKEDRWNRSHRDNDILPPLLVDIVLHSNMDFFDKLDLH